MANHATEPVGELVSSGRRRSRYHVMRWAVVAGTLWFTVAVAPLDSGAAGSPLGKVSIITGPVSECDAGSVLGLPRPFVVTLHERPGGRVVATYDLRPSKHLSFYAFAVAVGTYYLSTSESTSPPPHGNIVIGVHSKNIISVPIATVCQ